MHPQSNTWTVDGTIDGADNQALVLEASHNGHWYPLDTVVLKGRAISSLRVRLPDIPTYTVCVRPTAPFYFPIDSIETVTVNASASAFDTDYTLAGSQAAESLMAVDRKLIDVANRLGAAAVTDSLLKRDLGTQLLSDPSGIVAYYIINKR